MAKKMRYQVWALLRTERGTETWQPVTDKYATRRAAERIAVNLWLTTRVDESEPDEDDEPDETALIENFENAQYEGA